MSNLVDVVLKHNGEILREEVPLKEAHEWCKENDWEMLEVVDDNPKLPATLLVKDASPVQHFRLKYSLPWGVDTYNVHAPTKEDAEAALKANHIIFEDTLLVVEQQYRVSGDWEEVWSNRD